MSPTPKVKDREPDKEVVLHLITWNGNTFDLPMWILNTDEAANKRGEWNRVFGQVISIDRKIHDIHSCKLSIKHSCTDIETFSDYGRVDHLWGKKVFYDKGS